MSAAEVRRAFQQHFGQASRAVARAPGRVNLIGEHTDYNEGFVLPLALDRSTWVAVAPRSDANVRAYSTQTQDEQTWPVGRWTANVSPHWTAYIAGVHELLRSRATSLSGVDLYIASDVPRGAGLSSSAALELATATALAALSGLAATGTELADLAREAEQRFAGVPCGIMDQYVALLARAGHALLLDCRSRTYEHVPMKLGQHVVLVVDSGVRHELVRSEYTQRRAQCQAAVDQLQRAEPAVRALRDVDLELLERHAARLDPVVAARARHVVTENARTLAAAAALRAGELDRLGPLLAESQRSLRDDYAVSCPELDELVEIVGAVEGVLGARLTGGGFGGAIVAIADAAQIPAVRNALREYYDPRHPVPARLLETRPGHGATVEP